MTAALYAVAFRASLAPAVGVTSKRNRHNMTTNKAPEIAALNHLARQAMGVTWCVYHTGGICTLPPQDQSAIRERVEKFDAFTPDNDPYGEHDFGAFVHKGNRIFWKIDYYNTTLTAGSEDPSDPKQTVRVLTIMLASEY